MFGRNYAAPSVIKSIPGACKRFVDDDEASKEMATLDRFCDKVIRHLIDQVVLFLSLVVRLRAPTYSADFQNVPITYIQALLVQIGNSYRIETASIRTKIASGDLKGKELAREIEQLYGSLPTDKRDHKKELLGMKVSAYASQKFNSLFHLIVCQINNY